MEGRTPNALKMQWRYLREGAAEDRRQAVAATVTAFTTCALRQGERRQPSPAAEAESRGQRTAATREPQLVDMAPLTGVPRAPATVYQARKATWTRGVKCRKLAVRAPSTWQRVVVAMWRLSGRKGAGLRAVALGAEQQRRLRTGGSKGASVGERQPLHTLLAARVQRVWLYGPQVPGGGRLARADEYAWWMGICRWDPGWSAARRLLAEEEQIRGG